MLETSTVTLTTLSQTEYSVHTWTWVGFTHGLGSVGSYFF